MIEIVYDNIDIEALMTKGQGRFLSRIPKKKDLIKLLKAFMNILEVISATQDLLHYKWLKYNEGADISFVQLVYGGHPCILLFSEQEDGRKITITDVKV